MTLFASNTDQLKRLNGEEPGFNGGVWGKKVLAYLVANGSCGVDTARAISPPDADPRAVGTARFMRTQMIDALDGNHLDGTALNDADDPDFA